MVNHLPAAPDDTFRGRGVGAEVPGARRAFPGPSTTDKTRVSTPLESATNSESASDLVLEGWRHLRLQRPLAAWASWQRALRVQPDDPAARNALELLAKAPEFPSAARVSLKFLPPPIDNPDRRARWDSRLQNLRLDDLNSAAETFASLGDDDPADANARLNQALCLAWIGLNTEAVGALEQAVAILATTEPGRAADAWTLAEVLRLGAGAETLADDCRYAWVLDLADAPELPPGLFESWPNLVAVEIPTDPITGAASLGDGQMFEWLDRPIPPIGEAPPRARDLPRVLASVVATPRAVRVSSPDPSGFEFQNEPDLALVRRAFATARRERTPLSLAWADAALGTFKLPFDLDAAARADLTRATVEHYHEDLWLHLPRLGLDHRSPLQAAALAAGGDAVALAKLSGLIGFREQLGARTSHAAVYLGYPFDRLRRRLGLIAPDDSAALDAEDLSCASGLELDALDPSTLDAPRLVDGFVSAIGLRDDLRVCRFAEELASRDPKILGTLKAAEVYAPLVREALRAGDPEQALSSLRRARSMTSGLESDTFAVWSAEVYARTGSPQAALQIYQDLLHRPDSSAALALDGAETLLDNGYGDQALPLILDARERAEKSRDQQVLQKTEVLLRRR